MKNILVRAFEDKKLKSCNKNPKFRAGDTVKVFYKIQEGAAKDKFRIQPFEGVVIRLRRGTLNASFTVRKIGANNIGVERVFPLFSPYVDKIEIVASGVVRRARLFYLRDLAGKAARIRSRYFFTKATDTQAPTEAAPAQG